MCTKNFCINLDVRNLSETKLTCFSLHKKPSHAIISCTIFKRTTNWPFFFIPIFNSVPKELQGCFISRQNFFPLVILWFCAYSTCLCLCASINIEAALWSFFYITNTWKMTSNCSILYFYTCIFQFSC